MIVIRIWEGLGNQLFQYAYARALQLRTGKKVVLDTSRIYKDVLEGRRINREYTLDYFSVRMPIAHNIRRKFFFLERKNIIQKLLFALAVNNIWFYSFYEEKDILYKSELEYQRDNRYLMGWFQNEKYFKEYRDILLKELVPKEKIRISTRLRELLENRMTISVHVRRGDFQKSNNVLPRSYYQKAREYLESCVERPFYLIFSDDSEWVRRELDFGKNVYYISEEGLKDYEELFVMSRCKHNIIANSTFSWWGAWLNQNDRKVVVGPRIWFNNKQDGKKYNIMPEEWIRIEG